MEYGTDGSSSQRRGSLSIVRLCLRVLSTGIACISGEIGRSPLLDRYAGSEVYHEPWSGESDAQ
jgi:hypothetical protein